MSADIAGPSPEPLRTRSRRQSGATANRKSSTPARSQEQDAKETGDPRKSGEPTSEWKVELLEFLRQMRDEFGARNEGLLKLHRQATEEIRANTESGAIAVTTEDGTNMSSFLRLFEKEFRERGVPEEQWGSRLKYYFSKRNSGKGGYQKNSGDPV
ncbi:LOW QUALITY PROTEIN: uncharacterized protein EMH_0080990 [Eimeria mitis]|uniref:Uncharacterized protein n=1 Tax=Eimeria mitis TaxID=44415 RepID=U6KLQ6_9EIME|nr:LOW QUALITY PROTEIN: uncharacterized protein EMH_0080990 [Eimeria mitis]CDJ36363.1 hypothetical protein EMH_0080990 [Eimeria mitis]